MKILLALTAIFLVSCGSSQFDTQKHIDQKNLDKKVMSCIQEKQLEFEEKLD